MLLTVQTENDLNLDLSLFNYSTEIQRSSGEGNSDSLIVSNKLSDGSYLIKLFDSGGNIESDFESRIQMGLGIRRGDYQYPIINSYPNVMSNNDVLYKIEKDDDVISITRSCQFDKLNLPGNYDFTVYENWPIKTYITNYQSEITLAENDVIQVEFISENLEPMSLEGKIVGNQIEFENGHGTMCGNNLYIDVWFVLGFLYGAVEVQGHIEATKN